MRFTTDAVAQRLGLLPDEVTRLRSSFLVQGTGWDYQKNAAGRRVVEFTEAGLNALAARLGVDLNAATIEPTTAQEPEKKAAAPVVVALTIERLCPNPIWVQSRVEGVLVNVRVPTNKQMRPGQVMTRCQRLQSGDWLFLGVRDAVVEG